jgi:hypothetical protein
LPSRLAFEQLKESASAAAGIQYGMLKLSPSFDPLRADPAFQKLCEEKQP